MDLLFSVPAPAEEPEIEERTTLEPPRKVESAVPAPAPPSARSRRVAEENQAAVAPALPERRVWTIRDLVSGVRRQLEREYDDIWVEGEISNCRPAASGHIYFTLKDGDAQLAVVLFRMQAQLLRFRPQDGLAVLVRGRISVYEQRGQLQMIAETVEARGAGALQLAFEQLKAKLLAEGLFDQTRKRSLPAFPRCVGVVTSRSGAVLHDIIKVVRRRHARLHLLVYPAAVQGPNSSASVAAGVRWFNANSSRVDVILIARGGGSIEDLAGFNEEGLARVIAASELPVVSAVGHETDFTIADFVADLRAPTPSAAAEIITAAQHRIEERVQELDLRLRRAVRYQTIMARQRYATLSAEQVLGRVRDVVYRRAQRVDDLLRTLQAAMSRHVQTRASRLAGLQVRLERQNPSMRLAVARKRLDAASGSFARLASATIAARGNRLNHATARLQALSPLAVLNRGYALVYSADGKLLRDAAEVSAGEGIRARLARGVIEAEVKKTEV